MPRQLKVYRLPIGFHDAYVAAPSQKAAAEAWGADLDVFRRGQAELVEDPALTGEPLARPGEVVKRLRGTAAEQLAALDGEDEAPPPRKRARTPAKPPAPRPSRADLKEVERLLAEAEARHEAELARLRDREAELARDRAVIEQDRARETERLRARRHKAEAAYEQAIRRWRASA